jgi:hypothetical protein
LAALRDGGNQFNGIFGHFAFSSDQAVLGCHLSELFDRLGGDISELVVLPRRDPRFR